MARQQLHHDRAAKLALYFLLLLQVSCALWVLGEYSSSQEEVQAAIEVINTGLGPLPLLVLEGARGGLG